MTVVLPSVRTVFTGAVTTGIRVMRGGGSFAINERLAGTLNGAGENNDDNNPPPHQQATPQGYLLTPPTVEAIVRSWVIVLYNPPGTGTNAGGWLSRVRNFCEQYEVPATQRALCAMHHMRVDCREAARAAGCYDMTWDQFAVWLHVYDSACISTTLRFL